MKSAAIVGLVGLTLTLLLTMVLLDDGHRPPQRMVSQEESSAITALRASGVQAEFDAHSGYLWVQLDGTITRDSLERVIAAANVLGGIDHLKCSGVTFEADAASAFENCSRIRLAEFGWSNLGDQDLAMVSIVNGIEELDLQYTEVTDAAADSILKITGLTTLDLSGTAVGDGICRRLQSAHLCSLILANTKVSDRGVCWLSLMTGLRELRVSATSVGSSAATCISKSDSISIVAVDRTDMTAEDIRRIASSAVIQKIYVDAGHFGNARIVDGSGKIVVLPER
jgi:hypothetical protein